MGFINAFWRRGMVRRLGIKLVLVACMLVGGGGFLWWKLSLPQQSMVRLASALKMKELGWAVRAYEERHRKLPRTLKELNPVQDIRKFDEFEYVGGKNGILAYRKEPFRKVERGEPWGGNGQVAKQEIRAARLVLFNDGSIRFLNDSEFRANYKEVPPRTVNARLEELVPGMNWSKWYEEKSGYRPDPKDSGAYVTLPVGNTVYIGLGTGVPTVGDGALVARFNGRNVEAIGALSEEGIHVMLWDGRGGVLHIAGTDPSWPDDWSAGNHYTYQPARAAPIIKYRDPKNGLVNVIHTWGLWMSDDHVLYAAVSSHDGSFIRDTNLIRRMFNHLNWLMNPSFFSGDYGITRMGQIFKSTDNGKSWRRLSDVGYFRAYDIIGSRDTLYALYTDAPESPCKLAMSRDGGRSWRDVTHGDLQKIRLSHFQDKLLSVSLDGRTIYALTERNLQKIDVPQGFSITAGFNMLTVADGFLYALCRDEDGNYCVLRSHNLHDWEKILAMKERMISVSYWPARQSLIIGTSGTGVRVWKVSVPDR